MFDVLGKWLYCDTTQGDTIRMASVVVPGKYMNIRKCRFRYRKQWLQCRQRGESSSCKIVTKVLPSRRSRTLFHASLQEPKWTNFMCLTQPGDRKPNRSSTVTVDPLFRSTKILFDMVSRTGTRILVTRTKRMYTARSWSPANDLLSGDLIVLLNLPCIGRGITYK